MGPSKGASSGAGLADSGCFLILRGNVAVTGGAGVSKILLIIHTVEAMANELPQVTTTQVQINWTLSSTH